MSLISTEYEAASEWNKESNLVSISRSRPVRSLFPRKCSDKLRRRARSIADSWWCRARRSSTPASMPMPRLPPPRPFAAWLLHQRSRELPRSHCRPLRPVTCSRATAPARSGGCAKSGTAAARSQRRACFHRRAARKRNAVLPLCPVQRPLPRSRSKATDSRSMFAVRFPVPVEAQLFSSKLFRSKPLGQVCS